MVAEIKHCNFCAAEIKQPECTCEHCLRVWASKVYCSKACRSLAVRKRALRDKILRYSLKRSCVICDENITPAISLGHATCGRWSCVAELENFERERWAREKTPETQ